MLVHLFAWETTKSPAVIALYKRPCHGQITMLMLSSATSYLIIVGFGA